MVAWSPACSRRLALPLPPSSIQPGSSSSNKKLFRNTAEQEKVDTHTLATMEARVQPLNKAFTAGSEPVPTLGTPSAGTEQLLFINPCLSIFREWLQCIFVGTAHPGTIQGFPMALLHPAWALC